MPLTPEGEEALKRALRIVEADPEASPQTRIETLLQMGDWYQIKKLPREALPYYQRAWQLSRTAPYPPSSASTTLNVPVRVHYPQPQIVGAAPAVHAEEMRSHYVQVEFTVAADGSVRGRAHRGSRHARPIRAGDFRCSSCFALSAEVRRRTAGRGAGNNLP